MPVSEKDFNDLRESVAELVPVVQANARNLGDLSKDVQTLSNRVAGSTGVSGTSLVIHRVFSARGVSSERW